ncbi:MAG TPA: CoA-transferase [Acidimicrobiales bacterium]|nr:CoA-transferase [Acidimicrobiales bacterium]
MAEPAEPTAEETMTVVASRQLADGDVCLVGIGLPSLAANLARRLHAPACVLIYESGTIGSKPAVPPLSIGDGELADTADTVVSVPEIFNYWLQAGRVDVGFLGAAQIDRHANLNTTVIGRYDAPEVRLPGAGGAPEIASSARRVVVVLRHSRRTFVEQVDFRTSVPGPGPTVVITDLGVLERSPDRGELELRAVHPGTSVDDVRAATGWELRVAGRVTTTAAPTGPELEALRALRAAMAP